MGIIVILTRKKVMIYRNIVTFCKDLFRPMKRFYRKVTRIMSWIPIIWTLPVWDSMSVFITMRKALIDMEKCIRNGFAANCEKTADEILHAIRVLDRICERDYHENACIRFGEKSLEDLCSGPISLPCGKNKSKRIIQIFTHSAKMQMSDIKYILNFISKKQRNWWD